ncbi:MAG: FGGY-family carbohydrate kinase, partial [Thermoguttaceae bacterium]
LTGWICTDNSYASGSGVYDLTGWDYADELIGAAGLRREIFPEIVPSTHILGELTSEAAKTLGLPRSVKVAAGGVDNSCMALGARNIAESRIYASLGSSSWVAVSSDKPLLDDRAKPYVFTHVMPGMFTSAIGVFSTGSSFKWVRDNMCADLVARAENSGENVWQTMIDLAGNSPIGANRLLFNPSLAGGSSREPSPNIRGGFIGLDLGHTRADLIRAAMEGIALNLRLAIDELRGLCHVCDEMVAVGGGSQSPVWQQIYADAMRITVVKTNVGQEAGSLGAAAVAAVGAGLWNDFRKIDQVHEVQNVATPIPENAAAYEKLLQVFDKAAHCQAKLGDMMVDLEI